MAGSSLPSAARKILQTDENREDHEECVTIAEKVGLTKNQYEVLNIICNTYEESVSQYMQEALIEAMRFDIEEGNFSDVLLEKIGCEDKVKDNSSSSSPLGPDLMNSDLDLLKKLQTQQP